MSKRNFKQHRPLFATPVPKEVNSAKIQWKILPVIWLATKRMAMTLGFLMLINIALMLVILPAFVSEKGNVPSLPDEMVLFLEFEDGFYELPEVGGFADPFGESTLTVREMVDAIERATDDDRVKGIFARMRGGDFALTHVYELRAALKRFRDAGKFAHIYSSSYGEGGGGLGRYYLASAFDQIWMQPLGIVTISGVSAEIPFMRGTLDKLGVEPQFFQRKEYKTAYESLTSKGISKYNKEMMERLVGDIRAEILATIPLERGMKPAAFEKLVNKGLFTSAEAEKAGLITRADYGDILLDDVAEELTGERDIEELDIVTLKNYAALSADDGGLMGLGKAKVALVYTVGAIMPKGDDSGFGADGIAAADEIAPAILQASRDEDVKAIVLRVDSPGGSPTASESILRAVEKAQERGKIVVVSMGATAASGGYWVSAYADRIFALPTTLTGSIGVVGGKFAIEELSSKLGVNWDKVTWGKNAGMWSLNTPFNASEGERINAMLDQVYDSFIARVAKGRKMEPEAVDKIAGGRVWTGTRAVEVGLVDEIGGLNDALDYVAVQLEREGRNDLKVEVLPKPKTPLEQLLELFGAQVQMGQAVKWQARVMEVFQPALEMIQVHSGEPVSTYEAMRLQ